MLKMNLLGKDALGGSNLSRKEIISLLCVLNSKLMKSYEIQLCGSASVILRNVDFKGTLDIDSCDYPDDQIMTLLDQDVHLKSFDINAVGVIGLLIDYEDRLVIIPLNLDHLTVKCISRRDWIVSKLASPKLDDVLNNTEVTLEDLIWVQDNMHKYGGVSVNRTYNDLNYLIRVFKERNSNG